MLLRVTPYRSPVRVSVGGALSVGDDPGPEPGDDVDPQNPINALRTLGGLASGLVTDPSGTVHDVERIAETARPNVPGWALPVAVGAGAIALLVVAKSLR